MSTTTTPNLGLRISSTLTPDSIFNLQRIDDLASRFVIEVDQSTAMRSATSVTVEPNSSFLGGTGVGGEVQIGTSSHSIDLFKVWGPIAASGYGLSDLAPSVGSLQLQYNSALHTPSPDSSPRILTLDVQGANRAVTLGGDIFTIGALDTAGSGDLTLSVSGATVFSIPPGSSTAVTTSRTVSTIAPLLGGGPLSDDLSLSLPKADAAQDGYLSSVDWLRFDAAVVGGVIIGEPVAGGIPGNTLVVDGSGNLSQTSPGGGTVTSVDVTGGATGLTAAGGPITGSGVITLSGTLASAHGGTGTTTAFTAGSVVFAGASGIYAQDNTKLFWNDSGGHLGVGTNTPAFSLDINGDINFSGRVRQGGSPVLYSTFGSNIYVGIGAGNTTNTSPSNTAIGANSLANNTQDGITAIGSSALQQNTTGIQNTATGFNALSSSTTGSGNSAFGYLALENNVDGSNNTAVGVSALQQTQHESANTAVGAFSLQNVITGGGNTAVGNFALNLNTDGDRNVAIAPGSLQNNTTGADNVGIGSSALFLNATGNGSVAMGRKALFVSTVSSNTAVGFQSLQATTTGGSNTSLGSNSGVTNTTGAGNTFIGAGADATSGGFTNSTALGTNAKVGAAHTIVLGDSTDSSLVVGIGTNTPVSKFSVGASSQFQVNAAGNLVFVNGVAQSWPGTQGAAATILTNDGAGNLTWSPPAASGTVTSVSVVSVNGLAGSVANPTTTPAITLSTTVTGVAKGNGTSLLAAVPGTDYSAGTSGLATGILKNTTGSGTLAIAVAGDFPTLNQNTTGSAASFTGSLVGDVTGTQGATVLSATTNGTLTTLSALSLPGSQVMGNISGNAANVTGTVAISHGGTGQTTISAAFAALSPLTTKGDVLGYDTGNNRVPVGSNGQVLTADSTQTLGLKWATPTTGTVTSVAVSGGTTGLTTSGGPITGAGTITLAGTLGVANGGTGDTTLASNGVLYGNGTAAVQALAVNATVTNKLLTQSSSGAPAWSVLVSGDIPNNAANTTGTASNVTAASNATLTTLSSLSLPGAQVTGNISGNAANVTGTIAVANGGTGATTVTGARTALGIGAGSQFVTSGTTFTTASTITTNTQFKFTLVGGGGGGSGINTANRGASGGGAGGGGIIYLTGLTPSTGYTIQVGAGGTAGAATPTAGGNGGSTTLTVGVTTYTSSGGTGGGIGSGVDGGAGGTTTNMTIDMGGNEGEPSTTVNSVSSGAGGDSIMGWGGAGIVTGTAKAGTGFGSGGGGGFGATATGATGAQGAILVEWWN